MTFEQILKQKHIKEKAKLNPNNDADEHMLAPPQQQKSSKKDKAKGKMSPMENVYNT